MSGKDQMRLSREQERATADNLGGKRVAYSGSRWESPGDALVGERFGDADFLMVECKRTNGTSQITIKRKDLDKNRAEADAEGRYPALAFALAEDRYIIVDEDYLADVLDELRELREKAGET